MRNLSSGLRLGPLALLLWSITATFAVIMATGPATAQSRYLIQPGDTLQIEVLEDTSLNRNALVLPDGRISFPLIGTLTAAGRSVDGLRNALVAALTPEFAAPPTVFVSVGRVAEREQQTLEPAPIVKVFAMGEVAQPGAIDAEPGVTLLQALAQAGGFTRFAAFKRVELRRSDPSTGKEYIYLFNYRGGGGIPGSTVLQEGDVIVVPERRLFE